MEKMLRIGTGDGFLGSIFHAEMRVLLLDNHDSFSAILLHHVWELAGEKPLYRRNDELSREELSGLAGRVDAAVLSPGPGHPQNPRDFGICRDLLELFPELPVLGVCLGHQGLAHFAGARIVPWPRSRHGRPSPIHHDGRGIFQGLPRDFSGMRYHSLIVENDGLPANLEITARSGDDNQIMALRFRDQPWFGVQFHPESVGTEHGKSLLANFLDLAKPRRLKVPVPVAKKSEPKSGTTIPYREIPWQEPEQVFLKHFSGASPAFWLDGSGWGATCMGRADAVFTLDEKILPRVTDAPWSGYRGGPVGHFEYESGGRWMVPEGYLVFDRPAHRAFAAWNGKAPPAWLELLLENLDSAPSSLPEAHLPPFSEWKPLIPRTEYINQIRNLQEEIRVGNTYEACFTHSYSTEFSAAPLAVFLRLRRGNPAPYSAYFAFPDLHLLSASPELFLEHSPDGVLRSRPIKGTRPRGKTPREDKANREDLQSHSKDRAENLMITDLTRHDFCRVCALGSVETGPLLEVEAHPSLFQLVSEVRGRLETGLSPLDAVTSCFPGGSMTGAPKERTMELLAAAEVGPRGAYSGAMGYFTGGDAFRLSMVIRTLENRDKLWRVGCGGAILIDSEPESEWDEAELKARSVIDAAGSAGSIFPPGP